MAQNNIALAGKKTATEWHALKLANGTDIVMW